MHHPEASGPQHLFGYGPARALGRLALRIYFRRVEILGREHLPRSGPVVLAANHPQSITDALVLGASLPRPLHFLAHGGLFRNRMNAYWLHRFGVLPIHRPAEEAGAAERNLEIFAACRRALEAGSVIAIFPEGVSREERRVQPLRTGAARIVLESEAIHRFQLGVALVPVGISFESRGRFRTRVLIRIGPPLVLGEEAAAYAANPRETVVRVTEALQQALGTLVVHLEHVELGGVVADLEATYREELLARRPDARATAGRFAPRLELSQEFVRAVEYYAEHDPELVRRLSFRLREYRRLRDRMRLEERFLDETRRTSLPGEILRLGGLAALGFPFALYGAFWNAIPYKLTGILARRRAVDGTKLHWHQLTLGAVLYLLYYPPLLWLARERLGNGWTLAFALSLIPTGFLARSYRRALARHRNAIRFARLAARKRYAVDRLRALRHRLLEDLDRVREDYLRRRDLEPPAPGRES